MAPFDRLRVVSKVEPQAPAGGIGTLRGWEAALKPQVYFLSVEGFLPEKAGPWAKNPSIPKIFSPIKILS